MTYDEIVAELIRFQLQRTPPRSHERAVLDRYDSAEAAKIVARLNPDTELPLSLRDDEGTERQVRLPLLRIGPTLHVVPLVVAETVKPDDALWMVTQGFASRLRDYFTTQAPSAPPRVLLIFDAHPIETERTTSSDALAQTLDSLGTLSAWLVRVPGFEAETRAQCREVLKWWESSVERYPEGIVSRHASRLEHAANFARACAAAGSITHVGEHLPKLGLLFADRDLNARNLKQRLRENEKLARELESLRRHGVRDPLIEAEKQYRLTPDDPVAQHLIRALRGSDLVTCAPLTLEDVQKLRRTAAPARLKLSKISANSDDASMTQWQYLRGGPDVGEELDDLAELVVAAPDGRVTLTVDSIGDEDGFVYYSAGTDRPELVELPARGQLQIELPARKNTFSVWRLDVRKRRNQRGRPLQTLKVSVIQGLDLVVPLDGRLDEALQSYVVDTRAGSVRMRVGQEEYSTSENLPESSDRGEEADFARSRIRWAAEPVDDPGDPLPAPPRQVRLPELHALRVADTIADWSVTWSAAGMDGWDLVITSAGQRARLDVPATFLEQEAKLLRAPEQFAGLKADNAAAAADLRKAVSHEFTAWLESRREFFSAVIDQCQRRFDDGGRNHPSLYIADLREPELARSAERYIEAYRALLRKLSDDEALRSQRALLEPILLCDRADESARHFTIAPTHPLSVALLATLQQGIIPRSRTSNELPAVERLLQYPLLTGVLPWLAWRKRGADVSSPALLWRTYSAPDDPANHFDADLASVIEAKVKRLLQLSPHLQQLRQRIVFNVALGASRGRYVVEALKRLVAESDDLSFEVRIAGGASEPELLEIFGTRRDSRYDEDRRKLAGRVEVARISTLGERDAHLAFRATAGASEPVRSGVAVANLLVRDTAFGAGLLQEWVRFANTSADRVEYTSYSHAEPLPEPVPAAEELWDGPWRRRFLELGQESRRLAVALHHVPNPEVIPATVLEQRVDSVDPEEYAKAFLTVHCDPAQGPEFFLSDRMTDRQIYLVECSDLGQPALPRRDVVTVTKSIEPFRAAIAAALRALPPRLRELVDEETTRGLLRDANLLRGSDVFNFIREGVRDEPIPMLFFAALGNILAFRFFTAVDAPQPAGYFPVALPLADLSHRSPELHALSAGVRCDDLLVLYLPNAEHPDWPLLYRLVEVKYRATRRETVKASEQLRRTAAALSRLIPPATWREHDDVRAVLLQREVALLLHEALERYRAFGLISSDGDFEREWGLKALFRRLNRGAFVLRPGGYSPDAEGRDLLGTLLVLDAEVPGKRFQFDFANRYEQIFILSDLFGALLKNPARREPPPPPLQAPPPKPVVEPSAPATPGPAPAEVTREPVSSATGVGTPDARRIVDVFVGFIGNAGVVERLQRELRFALLERQQVLEPLAFYGSPSTGKTELARRTAAALGVPMIALSKAQVTSSDDLAAKIREVAAQQGTAMPVEDDGAMTAEVAPPMVVFIDEVHQLRRDVQDSLLTATEPHDRMLRASSGNISTRNVTFIIATTDPGRLAPAFRTRFKKLELQEYSHAEVVQILRAHRERAEDLPVDALAFDEGALGVIATTGRLVPRQALDCLREAAKAVRLGDIAPNADALRAYFLRTRTADDRGLTERDRRYLLALFPDRRRGREALAVELGEDPTTVEAEIEPYLLKLKFIERDRSGRVLTDFGRQFAMQLRRVEREQESL